MFLEQTNKSFEFEKINIFCTISFFSVVNNKQKCCVTGKYPWRHAFRRHLSRNPSLWYDSPDPSPAPSADSQVLPQIVKSDISLSEARTVRKRCYSSSDESAVSGDSLEPAEREFDSFYDEVNRKW